MKIKIRQPSLVYSATKTSNGFFVYYIFSRIFFMIAAIALSGVVMPYYTYDGYQMYSKVTLSTINPSFYISQRQLWMVICAAINSIEIFRIIQLPRIINIFLGWYSIVIIGRTMGNMGYEQETIKKTQRFLTFFPVYIIFTCSFVKDVLFLCCVWGLMNELIRFINREKISIFKAIVFSILGMANRFGVIESLLAALLAVYIFRRKGIKRILAIIVVGIIGIIAIQVWNNTGGSIIYEQKTRIYLGSENEAIGTKSYLQLIADIIIRLFGAGPQLHPQEGELLWISFLGYLSIFNIYILIWFAKRILQKHKSWAQWFIAGFLIVWLVFLSYVDSIIYRQILFLQPAIWIIGCGAMYENGNVRRNKIPLCCSIIVFLLMFIYVRL